MTNDRRQIKRATELLCKSLGGYEAAAAIIGKGKTTVHRWADRNDDEAFANVADVAELEANAADPLVTIALCRLNGGVFTPLPDCAADPDTLAGMVLQLHARLGEISREMGASLANDGKVDEAEAAKLLDLQHEHDSVSAQLRLALEAIIARREPRA